MERNLENIDRAASNGIRCDAFCQRQCQSCLFGGVAGPAAPGSMSFASKSKLKLLAGCSLLSLSFLLNFKILTFLYFFLSTKDF